MNHLNLFIDELGSPELKEKYSKHYILTGCLVNDINRSNLKVKADQIKFKYWGKTDIVFHSREIGRKIGDFNIFKNIKIFRDFQEDIFKFLMDGIYQLYFVVVDKKEARIKNWNSLKIYSETADILIKYFVLSLLANKNKGRIVIESATTQRDFFFYKNTGFYLSNGIKNLNISYKEVQNALTEISFVTKKNFDIEEQIADLLSYGAKLKVRGKKKLSEYEKNIVKVMKAKLFRMHPETGERKKKFYSEIKSFVVLP